MRARLDELDAAGRDLSRLVGEMREVMDGRRQDPRGVPTREQFDERERELESARGRMDEGNAAAARLESHVEEMKRVMARAEGGGGDDHDHDHDVGGGETEADRRAAQLALEEATYVVREATRRADDIATAYAEKRNRARIAQARGGGWRRTRIRIRIWRRGDVREIRRLLRRRGASSPGARGRGGGFVPRATG